MRDLSRRENKGSRPGAHRLLATLNFVLPLENVQCLIFVVVRVQGRATAGWRGLREDGECAVGLVAGNQQRDQVAEDIQVGPFTGAKDDGSVCSKKNIIAPRVK